MIGFFQKDALLGVLLLGLILAGYDTIAQRKDSTLFFKSALSVTNNGFSFIPSFSLGKPAAILDIGVGNKRLSFEPQFRFALEGRPWSFIFIYRYKLINKDRFQLRLGGHLPAFNFINEPVTMNGVDQDAIVTKRFLAGELWPYYILNKNIAIGLYCLRGHGFDPGTTRDATFAGFQTYFTNVNFAKFLVLTFTPQVFYLKTDNDEGVYATYNLNVAVKNFPISVSNIINKSISTEIPNTDFSWNVSLVYSFSKDYKLR